MRPEIHLFNDSMITLVWIAGNKSKDKFIRTRVAEISSVWRYVKSKENPTDMGSRGPLWVQLSEEKWSVKPQEPVAVLFTCMVEGENIINM